MHGGQSIHCEGKGWSKWGYDLAYKLVVFGTIMGLCKIGGTMQIFTWVEGGGIIVIKKWHSKREVVGKGEHWKT